MAEVVLPPWNFSWIDGNQLAAMACPQSVSNLEYLVDKGIGHLITLSPETIPPIIDFPKLSWTKIPIEEFTAPSLNDIIKFIDICIKCHKEKKGVGVHCRMGRGRTGVMAACYLVHNKELAPERAITNLRLQRPGSIETPEQERAVVRYRDYLRGTKISKI